MVVAYGPVVPGVMLKNSHLVAIVAIQSILGTEPHKSGFILDNAINVTL
jgi:hypothetical protein